MHDKKGGKCSSGNAYCNMFIKVKINGQKVFKSRDTYKYKGAIAIGEDFRSALIPKNSNIEIEMWNDVKWGRDKLMGKWTLKPSQIGHEVDFKEGKNSLNIKSRWL